MAAQDDRYWSIDVPGLSESQAQELLAHAEVSFGLNGTAISPGRWLTRHMDVETVQGLVRALEVAEVEKEDRAVVDGVHEDFGDWLARSSRA